jgi:hypothetical protein
MHLTFFAALLPWATCPVTLEAFDDKGHVLPAETPRRIPPPPWDTWRTESITQPPRHPACPWRDPLDANSRQGGRSGSLRQVTGRWRFVEVVHGLWRCCTCVLYDCSGPVGEAEPSDFRPAGPSRCMGLFGTR